MGKSKKTRWRTFEIGGSQDETQTNGADVKVNETDSASHTPVTSQKYSQILGDHHTNSSTNQFSRNSSSYHIYKSRGYNNKENFYNQRAAVGRPGVQRSWQRGGNYRTSIVNGKINKSEEIGSSDAKVDSPAEPIKFNEDEYTRITTPRQDVLFKKGYLSRMNNKTATNLSATGNSAESTAASSTITTSDPDSSVSTLSPATTPSMDFGQVDAMDYPMYYPGYYDETGMLVIPMYNGYNYYPPNGSAASSPVYLMPYPYQYDPFFMTPSGLQPVDGDENAEEKTESDGAKENNQTEKENGDRTTSSSSEDGAASIHCEELKEEKKEDEKETENAEEKEFVEAGNPDQKQSFPIYPNELNGFMYPAYPNGYYNNFYYYNGAPASRPPKMKRRKRFLNSRNSQHHQPRSAETTTDYSDEENTTYNKRFTPRYQNGWTHHNGYNHYSGKFNRFHVDQNANQTPHEYHLNVDVQEFYPRVQPISNEETNVNCNQPAADLEQTRSSQLSKPKVEAPKATKTSHPSKPSAGRVSKKEIIEGIKSMEQQNIDLMATKHQTIKNASQDDAWNVIKKGKKVKVVKDIKMDLSSSDVQDVKEDKIEENKNEEPKTEIASVPEVVKKSHPVLLKTKKAKSKNSKKKKSHLMAKQDGFEIIEPEFNNTASNDVDVDEMTQELSEEETVAEAEAPSAVSDPEVVENLVLDNFETRDEPAVIVELEIVAKQVEETSQTPETREEKTPEVNDLREIIKNVDNEDDAVIDISNEDICRTVDDICLEMSPVPKVERVVEPKVEVKVGPKPEVQKKAFDKPEIIVPVQTSTETKKEIQLKTEAKTMMDPFQDTDFFSDRVNIAALERDLMENLKLLDDDFDLKSPIINPLLDFPITGAVRKWLQAKQSESFDSLFHVQNLKKLSELYDDEDDDETESNISEKEVKSETDSDYASDSHAKANGASPNSCSTHAKGSSENSSKCKKLIAKESFCALM